MQTNGVLLTADVLAALLRSGIRVGVSLDGDRAANDRHRLYASGRSSYDGVVAAINLLREPRFRGIYGGLLCTVDLANDPIDTYESLLLHEPPRVDFLLPHGNWVYPPPRLDVTGATTPYAEWLIAIFDRWYGAPRQETGIRLFESIIDLLLGGSSHTEAVGLDVPVAITIESDGSIEGSDGLKTTGPAGGATGLSVHTDPFDEVARHPLIASSRRGYEGLATECQQCRLVSACGGGLHAHRFSGERGFDRASVYCADLFRLIDHIRARVADDVSARVRQLTGSPS
jgi:uncharacterized protein